MKLCWVDRLSLEMMKTDPPVRSIPVYFSFDDVTGKAEVWPLPDRPVKRVTLEIDGE